MATFRPLYTISGAPVFTKGYGITAAEAFQRGDVVALDASGTLVEPATDAVDVLGIALEDVAAGVSLGPQSDICLVAPFTADLVCAVKEVANLANTPLTTDIGNGRDLDVDGTNGWGIHATASATALTPQVRVIDIDTIRNEWHVVIDPITVAAVYQWISAAV